MEARAGIEPAIEVLQTSALPLGYRATEKTPAQGEGWKIWSGRRDLNPRLRPWQGRTLPLSYSRSAASIINKPSGPSNGEPPTKLTSALSFLEPVSKFEIREPRFSAAVQTCFRYLTLQRT